MKAGSGSVAASTSSSSSLSIPRPTRAPISSAPSLSSSSSFTTTASTSSFGEEATEADPYPGFLQNAAGVWEAKDQATYDAWFASTLPTLHGDEPREFEGLGREGEVEFDANSGRKAWEERPETERTALAQPVRCRLLSLLALLLQDLTTLLPNSFLFQSASLFIHPPFGINTDNAQNYLF